jgi:hypothetical protein
MTQKDDDLNEHGLDREDLGERVREVWIDWAKTQPDPKPSWLLPWDEMSEKDREVDRRIGETIAHEATEVLREQLRAEQEARNREIGRSNRLAYEATTATTRVRRVALATLSLLLLVLGTVVGVTQNIPAPTVCPTPPACPACEVCEIYEAPPTVPTAGGDPEGYLVEGEFGGLRLVPWPDASAYPAETFRNDCTAVCSVPTPMGDEPGRVIVVDPTHLVCVCFHRESPWPVTRWINWQRGPR